MLHRKDFEAIAEIIKNEHCIDYKTRERSSNIAAKNAINDKLYFIADRLADYLSTQNPRFDRDKFLTACGVN